MNQCPVTNRESRILNSAHVNMSIVNKKQVIRKDVDSDLNIWLLSLPHQQPVGQLVVGQLLGIRMKNLETTY